MCGISHVLQIASCVCDGIISQYRHSADGLMVMAISSCSANMTLYGMACD